MIENVHFLRSWSLHLKSQANSSTKSLNPTEGVLQVSKWLLNIVVEESQVCVPCIGNEFSLLFLLDTVYSRLLNEIHIPLKNF